MSTIRGSNVRQVLVNEVLRTGKTKAVVVVEDVRVVADILADEAGVT